jgi:hypothetical protein
VRITATRAFLLGGGVRVDIGSEAEVEDGLARLLIAAGKAERAQPAPPPAAPMTTETVATLVAGKTKEKAHAGK